MKEVVVFAVCVVRTKDGVPVMPTPGFIRKGTESDIIMVPLYEAHGTGILQQRKDIHARIDKALDEYEESFRVTPCPPGAIQVWAEREEMSP